MQPDNRNLLHVRIAVFFYRGLSGNPKMLQIGTCHRVYAQIAQKGEAHHECTGGFRRHVTQQKQTNIKKHSKLYSPPFLATRTGHNLFETTNFEHATLTDWVGSLFQKHTGRDRLRDIIGARRELIHSDIFMFIKQTILTQPGPAAAPPKLPTCSLSFSIHTFSHRSTKRRAPTRKVGEIPPPGAAFSLSSGAP
jgi:hypothetical protein